MSESASPARETCDFDIYGLLYDGAPPRCRNYGLTCRKAAPWNGSTPSCRLPQTQAGEKLDLKGDYRFKADYVRAEGSTGGSTFTVGMPPPARAITATEGSSVGLLSRCTVNAGTCTKSPGRASR
jgi:hypothetical protein